MVSGDGRPRTYSLIGSFLVSEVDEDAEGMKYASGPRVASFTNPVPIAGTHWFPALRKATGNFGFGLQRLNNTRVIEGLLETYYGSTEVITSSASQAHGALLGTPDENKRVEQAAIKAVTKRYRQDGWQVISRESLNLGYDLHCQKLGEVRALEVKGVRGSNCSFILTSNEKDFAEHNESFRLSVVLNALRPTHRVIREFTRAQLLRDFSIEPLSFAVQLRV